MSESTARHLVIVVRAENPVQLREEVERLDWQLPLAPFIADDVALEVVVGLARRRARAEMPPPTSL